MRKQKILDKCNQFPAVIISAIGIHFLHEAYSSTGGSDSRGHLYLSTARCCVPAPPTACLISAEEAEHIKQSLQILVSKENLHGIVQMSPVKQF